MKNYHTHTYRCGHAIGDVDDYVQAARKAGLSELGFSDHMPHPDPRWPLSHMLSDELPGYVAAVGRARALEEARGSKGISILLGLECEWSAGLEAFYREELMGAFGVEYLLAGIHYCEIDGDFVDSFSLRSARELRAYARQVEGAVSSGLFACLAHPDVFMNGYLPWDDEAEACARDVLAACEAAQVPIEVNGNGLRKRRVPAPEGLRPPYPHVRFWELAADYDVTAIAGSDAHRPCDVGAGLEACRALAGNFGVRLAESLPIASRAPAL